VSIVFLLPGLPFVAKTRRKDVKKILFFCFPTPVDFDKTGQIEVSGGDKPRPSSFKIFSKK
jgi:hypothetical protein